MTQSRILIVEDENIVALDLEMRLSGLGYQVVGMTATGEGAIHQALSLRPDLILMDINLRGEIDGVEAALQIQQHQDIPIIFLTAYADDATFRRAVSTELFGYILKPFDEKELQMGIEIALYRHKMEKKLREVADENARLHQEVKMYAAELEKRVVLRTEQLAQAHDRLQLILDTVDEAVYFMDADSILLYMNPSAERITGYELSQVIGSSSALWRGNTSDAVIAQLDQAIVNGEAWSGDVINRRQDGVLYDAELRIIPLFDAAGDVESFVATQRDISSQKELQRLKEQFVFRIGHELRTPLTNFRLYLDLLKRGGVENHEKYTTILRHESKRLTKLILGFLEMAGLDTAADLPTLELLDINGMIVDQIKQNERDIQSGSLEIDLQLLHNLPQAMANKSLLERAFFHLLENAILYTPENGRITIITAVQPQKNRKWITIAVKNTGSNISPEEESVLFDRFYRGEAAQLTVTPGAGLGLAFCKESLEQQGGFITVNRNPETDVVFTIWLKTVVAG